jgi:hypothetical protein
MRYIINTEVIAVENRKGMMNGWYVHFEGSHEAVYLGEDKTPPCHVGQTAKITIEFGVSHTGEPHENGE